MRTSLRLLPLALFACALPPGWTGDEIPAAVHFNRHLRKWDGFGVNYVETAQTRDYKADPQEYGGFSTLSAAKRGEILELIFGADGLRPAIVKMFLDPFHEPSNDNGDPWTIDERKFDHQTTTQWMRYFVREGLRITRAGGRDLTVITTLYGPPAWTTRQKIVRGRDMDPAMKEEVAEYMVAWVKFLREQEKIPVRYLSVHNEGEDFRRWPTDGSHGGYPEHDYNMYWHSRQVTEFMPLVRKMLDRHRLGDVSPTPGETSTWDRFVNWGYAWDLAENPDALRSLGLITSHGFGAGGAFTSMGVDLLRLKRPELHAWTTSMSWGRMDAAFLEAIRAQIYRVGVNAVIPWAAIQTDTWVGGDPNPGTAFRVDRKGGYTVEPGYYYYKHVARLGQPGLAVAAVESGSPDVGLIAFSSAGTRHPDGFVIFNTAAGRRDMVVRVEGTAAKAFLAFETAPGRDWRPLGRQEVRNGELWISLSANAAVSFTAVQ